MNFSFVYILLILNIQNIIILLPIATDEQKFFNQNAHLITSDGSDENASPWRGQPSDEVIPSDENPSLTREGKSFNDASK